jgi:hypothetical protein
MAASGDRSSAAVLVRPMLGLALGAGTLPLLYAGVFPLLLPAMAAQVGASGLVAAEALLALLPYLLWAVLARQRDERAPIIAGGVLLAAALAGLLVLLRRPLAPGDDVLLPGLLWAAAVAGAAGLVVGNHLRLVRLSGGSGGRTTVLAAASATLLGPILANAILELLTPAAGQPGISSGPCLFWAAMALALAFVSWRSPAVGAAPTAPAGWPAVLAATIGLGLLLAPIIWLNAVRLPLLVHAASVAGVAVPGLLGQAAMFGYLAIAVVLVLAALHPGLATLLAGPLAVAIVVWALVGLDIQVPVSLAWAVSSDPAYALALIAGLAAILGRGAGPVRIALVWTALQAASVLGNRGGQAWWQQNQFVVTDAMRQAGIGMAVLGALVLLGIILARRARG